MLWSNVNFHVLSSLYVCPIRPLSAFSKVTNLLLLFTAKSSQVWYIQSFYDTWLDHHFLNELLVKFFPRSWLPQLEFLKRLKIYNSNFLTNPLNNRQGLLKDVSKSPEYFQWQFTAKKSSFIRHIYIKTRRLGGHKMTVIPALSKHKNKL